MGHLWVVCGIEHLKVLLTTACSATLSGDESLSLTVETTAVQSLQVSAVARASMAEVKMNAFMVEVNIIISYSYMVSLMRSHP